MLHSRIRFTLQYMKLIAKYTLILLLLLMRLNCLAQQGEELSRLYNERKYDEALAMGWPMLNEPEWAAIANNTLGRIHCDLNRPDSALIYLDRAIHLDGDKTWISGWSHAYKGTAFVMKGRVDDAIAAYKTAIKIDLTDNSVKYASTRLARIKPEGIAWQMVETDKIIYYFEDTAGLPFSAARYIARHDEAYTQLSEKFRPVLPRKFVMYVWNDGAKASKILGATLGFTNPEICTSHQLNRQTVGHEMMHAIAYWAEGTPPQTITKFVNEGVAVAFDYSLDSTARYAAARQALPGSWFHSVTEIWQQPAVSSDIVYPVGGAFMRYLYGRITREEYLSIIKNQKMEHAVDELGKERFNVLVEGFNNLIGIK